MDISPKYLQTIEQKIRQGKLPKGNIKQQALQQLELVRGCFYDNIFANIVFGYLEEREIEVLLQKLGAVLANLILVKENVLHNEEAAHKEEAAEEFVTPMNYHNRRAEFYDALFRKAGFSVEHEEYLDRGKKRTGDVYPQKIWIMRRRRPPYYAPKAVNVLVKKFDTAEYQLSAMFDTFMEGK